jgi:hypothetical protein
MQANSGPYAFFPGFTRDLGAHGRQQRDLSLKPNRLVRARILLKGSP